jgi:hypothetical protein
MRITTSNTYQPNKSEVREMASKLGVKTYSPSFAMDLAAIAAGESVLPISKVEAQVKSSVSNLTFEADSDGDYSTPGASWGRYTKLISQKLEYEVQKKLKGYQNLSDFLNQVSEQLPRIPGETPLEKAMHLLKKLSEEGNAGGEDSGEGEPLPVFVESSQQDNKVKEISQDLEILERLDDQDMELLEAEDDTSAYLKMGKTAREIFRVEQFCQQQAKLNVKPRSKLVKDEEGDKILFRVSRDFGDFPKVHRSALMSRNRLGHKILSQKAKVGEKYRKDTPLPLVSLILDESGSMSGGNDTKGLGVVYYLWKQASQGNCLGLFSFFEKRNREYHYLDENTDIEWFRKISRHSFNGGGTAVGDCALAMLEHQDSVVSEKGLNVDLRQKHLILVNDGQDDLGDFCHASLKGATLHSFILDSENEGLEKISKKSGGLYLENI